MTNSFFQSFAQDHQISWIESTVPQKISAIKKQLASSVSLADLSQLQNLIVNYSGTHSEREELLKVHNKLVDLILDDEDNVRFYHSMNIAYLSLTGYCSIVFIVLGICSINPPIALLVLLGAALILSLAALAYSLLQKDESKATLTADKQLLHITNSLLFSYSPEKTDTDTKDTTVATNTMEEEEEETELFVMPN